MGNIDPTLQRTTSAFREACELAGTSPDNYPEAAIVERDYDTAEHRRVVRTTGGEVRLGSSMSPALGRFTTIAAQEGLAGVRTSLDLRGE